jgi:hypothetical protein
MPNSGKKHCSLNVNKGNEAENFPRFGGFLKNEIHFEK